MGVGLYLFLIKNYSIVIATTVVCTSGQRADQYDKQNIRNLITLEMIYDSPPIIYVRPRGYKID
jgi:hypothetical protein